MKNKCKTCGQEFEAKQSNHKYCSDECRKIGMKNYRKNFQKNYWKTHPKQYKKNLNRKKIKRDENKLIVLIHYGGNPPKCACCGETIYEFLTIDHIDGGGCKHRKEVGSGVQFYHWLIENDEPKVSVDYNFGKKKIVLQ